MTETDLLYTLALQNTPKIGDILAKKLIANCGSPEAVINESPKKLIKIDGIGASVISGLRKDVQLKKAEKELRFIKDNNIKSSYFQDANYPEKLKHCIDGPILLFETGTINLKQKHIISIVGARKITSQGIAFCETLIESLKPYNPIIVSGFAYGADITAHKAALKHGLQTVACLAHGFNRIYPEIHKKYVSDVDAHGGFFSEFWSSADFDRKHFLRRNRIIAGISEATIVIESAKKGGSLVTADIANSYNRDVFAVPGRTTDIQSVGCNNLIKQQKAHILTTPFDVPYILNWDLELKQPKGVQKQLFVNLDEVETLIYNYLSNKDQVALDKIAINCNMPTFKVARVLLAMELKGVIRPLPGKLFEAL